MDGWHPLHLYGADVGLSSFFDSGDISRVEEGDLETEAGAGTESMT